MRALRRIKLRHEHEEPRLVIGLGITFASFVVCLHEHAQSTKLDVQHKWHRVSTLKVVITAAYTEKRPTSTASSDPNRWIAAWRAARREERPRHRETAHTRDGIRA